MVSNIDESSKKVPTFHIIREVYDSTNAHQRFEAELDKALEAKVDYIIIEPPRLGDETGRWITVGNCLHKTAVVSGMASLLSSLLWHNRPVIAGPMCAVSLFCTGLYTVSWNYDPCCQYQVENNEEVLNKLPLADVSSPVILGYQPNTKTKYLHRSVTLLSAAFCAWQIWRSYNSKKVPTFHIIREVYDSTNAHQRFEAELDKALEAKVDYIIIEPPRLGDETGRWITVGNCLHKTAVVSGMASLLSSLLWHNRPVIAGPMCAVSLFCTGLYTVSWNYDPCCQYQVENNEEVLNKLPLADVSSPVILGYQPNTKTKYLHRSVTLLSAAFCAWQIWRSYK